MNFKKKSTYLLMGKRKEQDKVGDAHFDCIFLRCYFLHAGDDDMVSK
jgi:hypothetical protein